MFLFATLDQITLDDPARSLAAPIWSSPIDGGAPRSLIGR